MKGRVLVVDDESDWIETFAQWLEPEGYAVRGVRTGEEARTEVLDWSPHVLLVDQKLEGPGGRGLGLSLIGRLLAEQPTAQAVLVTGFASSEAITRAFSAGASDYFEKNRLLESRLRAKLPVLVAASEHARGELDVEEAEALLRAAWARAQRETHSQRKGAALEEAVQRLFSSVPGFTHTRTNASNATEEIDVLVTNRSSDPLLQRQNASSTPWWGADA